MKTPVIDFHSHLGRWARLGMDFKLEEYVAIMDKAGIDISCVNCINFSDARRGNDLVARAITEYPDRFIGVAYVTPLYPAETIPELERCFNQLGFKFIKLYPDYLGKPIDDQSYSGIFEWANDRNIVIMSHSSYVPSHGTADGSNPGSSENNFTMPNRFIPLAEKYTDINWVLAHSGNARPGQKMSVEAAQKCPNIFLETCTSLAEHDTIELLVNEAGEDRILYGSDMPLMEPLYQIGRIITADISDSAKIKILGTNASKLLKIPAF